MVQSSLFDCSTKIQEIFYIIIPRRVPLVRRENFNENEFSMVYMQREGEKKRTATAGQRLDAAGDGLSRFALTLLPPDIRFLLPVEIVRSSRNS